MSALAPLCPTDADRLECDAAMLHRQLFADAATLSRLLERMTEQLESAERIAAMLPRENPIAQQLINALDLSRVVTFDRVQDYLEAARKEEAR